jgi:hypothetical protein
MVLHPWTALLGRYTLDRDDCRMYIGLCWRRFSSDPQRLGIAFCRLLGDGLKRTALLLTVPNLCAYDGVKGLIGLS